jgi:hypothetical protein
MAGTPCGDDDRKTWRCIVGIVIVVVVAVVIVGEEERGGGDAFPLTASTDEPSPIGNDVVILD